jgi:hypothetical protein
MDGDLVAPIGDIESRITLQRELVLLPFHFSWQFVGMARQQAAGGVKRRDLAGIHRFTQLLLDSLEPGNAALEQDGRRPTASISAA